MWEVQEGYYYSASSEIEGKLYNTDRKVLGVV